MTFLCLFSSKLKTFSIGQPKEVLIDDLLYPFSFGHQKMFSAKCWQKKTTWFLRINMEVLKFLHYRIENYSLEGRVLTFLGPFLNKYCQNSNNVRLFRNFGRFRMCQVIYTIFVGLRHFELWSDTSSRPFTVITCLGLPNLKKLTIFWSSAAAVFSFCS